MGATVADDLPLCLTRVAINTATEFQDVAL